MTAGFFVFFDSQNQRWSSFGNATGNRISSVATALTIRDREKGYPASAYLLRITELPGCVFSQKAEAAYDPSFEHFARLVHSAKIGSDDDGLRIEY